MDFLYYNHNPEKIRGYWDQPGRNWDFNIFDNQIINSCASIFIHNLDRNLFISQKINRVRHTLPFILRVSDELQDWERIKRSEEGDFYNRGELYKIEITGDTIKFSAPEVRRKKIEESIECFDGIQIIVQ